MCRSAIEEALNGKSMIGYNLDEKINNAQTQKLLGAEEVMQAHGARLIGNKALHQAAQVSQAQALNALTTTLDLLNAIVK